MGFSKTIKFNFQDLSGRRTLIFQCLEIEDNNFQDLGNLMVAILKIARTNKTDCSDTVDWVTERASDV